MLIRFLALALFFLFLASCTNEGDTPIIVQTGKAGAAGTSDGGGGNYEFSSIEEARASVPKVQKMLAKRLNFRFYEIHDLAVMSKQFKFSVNTDFLSDPNHFLGLIQILRIVNPRQAFVFENAHPDSWVELVSAFDLDHVSNVQIKDDALALPDGINYVNDVTFFISEDGDCPAADKDKPTASVSAYSFDAKVCFSAAELLKIPKNSLDAEVLGLWLHELAHMNGFGDREANQAQKTAVALAHKTGFFVESNNFAETDKINIEYLEEGELLFNYVAKIPELLKLLPDSNGKKKKFDVDDVMNVKLAQSVKEMMDDLVQRSRYVKSEVADSEFYNLYCAFRKGKFQKQIYSETLDVAIELGSYYYNVIDDFEFHIGADGIDPERTDRLGADNLRAFKLMRSSLKELGDVYYDLKGVCR